jgi:ubiquinone/menaquinone biosynthesis C-methylase UbiE
MADRSSITDHYASEGIADRILAALRRERGSDVAITPDTLAPLDQFHGRGLDATRDLMAVLKPRAGEQVLDIGCGIGGPARWASAQFGCHVTGVDLTPAFCEAAVALTQACAMSDRVRILQGSALALPVPDQAFDRAWSQNVLMNIADKAGFYREAFRVLRPGALFGLTSLAAGRGEPVYPTPWASTAATSFLGSVADTKADLAASGFELVAFREIAAPANQAQQREKLAREGLPALSIKVLMGERFLECQLNSMRNVEEGRTIALEYLLRKP